MTRNLRDWNDARVWFSPARWLYLLFSFEGRIPRLAFWVSAVAITLVSLLAEKLIEDVLGLRAAAIVSLAFLYPQIAITAKRAHDRGRSEMVLLVFFVPAFLINLMQVLGYLDATGTAGTILITLGIWVLGAMLWIVIDLGLMRGEEGVNAWGDDPLG